MSVHFGPISYHGSDWKWRFHLHRDIDMGWRIAIGPLRFSTHLFTGEAS